MKVPCYLLPWDFLCNFQIYVFYLYVTHVLFLYWYSKNKKEKKKNITSITHNTHTHNTHTRHKHINKVRYQFQKKESSLLLFYWKNNIRWKINRNHPWYSFVESKSYKKDQILVRYQTYMTTTYRYISNVGDQFSKELKKKELDHVTRLLQKSFIKTLHKD